MIANNSWVLEAYGFVIAFPLVTCNCEVCGLNVIVPKLCCHVLFNVITFCWILYTLGFIVGFIVCNAPLLSISMLVELVIFSSAEMFNEKSPLAFEVVV